MVKRLVEAIEPGEEGNKSSKKQARSLSPTKRTEALDRPYDDEDLTRLRALGRLPMIAKNTKEFDPPLDFLTPCPWVLPTRNNAISNFDPNTIAKDALGTTIIMHPRLPELVTSFLRLKRTHGSNIEKIIYADMSQHDLVVRLMEKRCLHFVQKHDYTVLRDCTKTSRDFDSKREWLRVGQANENQNRYIKMEGYLTYDEMMLSSLLGTSGPTFFINEGQRENVGRRDPKDTFQDRGIIVGLVGPRFARPGQMDAALMMPPVDPALIKSTSERQQDPRVTKMFLDFFGGKQAKLPGPSSPFSFTIYKARVRLTIETLLLESDDRAAQADKMAYVHLTGLGLGVWALDQARQGCWYAEVCAEILQEVNLKHIGTLEIAWVSADDKTKKVCVAAGEKADIKVVFNKRPPCGKLDTDELLVRCWAWDSNTLPGNEYWSGILDDSDDPAGVCNSTAAELHNPYANPMAHRIKVLQSRERI